MGVGDVGEHSENAAASAAMAHFVRCETAKGFLTGTSGRKIDLEDKNTA